MTRLEVASTRTSRCDRLVAAETLDLTLLQDPQQFRLQAQIHFRDLVEQQRTALGLFELAGARLIGAGEGTLLVTEQHRFEHVLGDRRAVDRDERTGTAHGVLVDVAREHLFAAAGFAGDHHRRIGLRHPAGQRQQFAGAPVLGDHRSVLGARHRQIAADHVDQHIGVEGLQQVIGRAAAHRVHRLLHRAVGGHQHHRQIRIAAADALEQGMSIHLGHLHIAHHHADALALQYVQRRRAVLGRRHRVTGEFQRVAQGLTQTQVIFNDQDGCLIHGSLLS
jgi:hypothetical protein